MSRPGFSPMADFFTGNPFAMMRRMQEEMDRNLARIFSGEHEAGGGFWHPAIEVARHDNRLEVHAELPGLKPEEIQVEATNDALVIQGERKSHHEERKEGTYRSERHYGRFYREIPLPEGANPEQANARFEDGVLQIEIPISEESSRRRKIQIGAGGQTGAKTGTSEKPATSQKPGAATEKKAESESSPQRHSGREAA